VKTYTKLSYLKYEYRLLKILNMNMSEFFQNGGFIETSSSNELPEHKVS